MDKFSLGPVFIEPSKFIKVVAPKQDKRVGQKPSKVDRNFSIGKDTPLLVALRDVPARAVCVCSGRLSVVEFLEVSPGYLK